jgi:hypothetical protein
MKIFQNDAAARTLLLGDLMAIGIAVWIGLQFHQLGANVWQRFAFTFLPWSLAWYIVAAKFKLFQWNKMTVDQIGQMMLAMIIASPLSAVLRATWLGTTALPLFTLIMGAVTALAIIFWRVIYSVFRVTKGTASG